MAVKHLCLLALVAVSLNIFFVQADLPVHCLHQQIAGTWKFDLGPVQDDSGLKVTCGHRIPDEDADHLDAEKSWKSNNNILILTLGEPNIVLSQDGQQLPNALWTMVYDEGFEVQTDKMKMFAFSKYEHSEGKTISHCGETLVGWYHNKDTKQWGCYRASKLSAVAPSGMPAASLLEEAEMDLDVVDNFNSKPSESTNAKFNPDSKWIESINRVQSSWKADVYDGFIGMDLKELNRMAGQKTHHGLSIAKEQHNAGAWSKKFNKNAVAAGTNAWVSAPNNGYPSTYVNSRIGKPLPTSWDWRNVDGKNYLPPIRQQGSCGSCYAMASMAMLTSRLRIMTDLQDQTILSPQHVLSCSYYNQACDGGYPYLVSKFSEDFFLVPETCMAYEASSNVPCSRKCDVSKLPRVYKATNYHYVGGFYGGCNEEAMRREVFENGPMVASFEPGFDFMAYDAGIYHSTAERTEFSPKQEWEKVDHSVLLVGFGEDEETNEKYWILMNTWGDNWGENGFFRMRRGVDESAIESIGVAAVPVIVEQSQTPVAFSFAETKPNRMRRSKKHTGFAGTNFY
eukprot:GILK01000413.1.p1 GENE.GILK01000413.1~~GILK01000413.1.p1  ORF type:complete len:589 (+),score=120.79 GILK01000413.1:68-1768(+)